MTLDVSSRPGALGRFIDIRRERCAAILQILKAGWKQASGAPAVHAGAGEVEITERLREGMRAALAAKAADWCRKMTVLPGTESRSSPDVPRPDGRTDVPIFFSDNHPPSRFLQPPAGARRRACDFLDGAVTRTDLYGLIANGENPGITCCHSEAPFRTASAKFLKLGLRPAIVPASSFLAISSETRAV